MIASMNVALLSQLSIRSLFRGIAGIGTMAVFALSPQLFANRATDIYVDQTEGDNAADGRTAPVKSIARAIRLAAPGDSIHLSPGIYYESASFTKVNGEPDKPIILDGHGAVLDGSEPVTSEEWEEVEPGLHRKVKLYPNPSDAIVGRWFLLWDGEMQRMNRTSKGPKDPLKPVADLQPGEWTYVEDEDAFYLRLPEGQKLDEANIRYPKRSNAVSFSSSGSHITVRNITGTHVYNDGFNVHGAQRNLVFENIKAIDCGDDGFSAHEDADCRIDGFVSIGNSTGLCDVNTSRTYYRNVYIRDCHGFDLYFIGLDHSLENALIESSAAKTFWLEAKYLDEGGLCNLRMKNVLIRRVGESSQELRIGGGGALHATNCTFEGVDVMLTPGGIVDFRSCLFSSGKSRPNALLFRNTVWRGQSNVYDFKSLRVDQTSFRPETFSDFQTLTGSEKESRWEEVDTAPDGVGADRSTLPTPE
ncbi:MAG: DUF1565 domain-containing protein [Verrucomicrobiales bacterium]|nr:DUF1565 domain-containing protein [Verrucomicrobiales bacterium]